MDRSYNQQLRLLFEDGTTVQQSAERIAGISRDLRSWFNFLTMTTCGRPAVMSAIMENGTKHRFKVAYQGDLRNDANFETA